MNWLRQTWPALARGITASRPKLRGDVIAGLTVAIMLVPQSMAYAMLAGLPPIIGLYASTVPLLVYALLGTSPQLAVGPVAIVSLLVASSVSQIAEPGSHHYIQAAILLALMTGIIQLTMGLLRLGSLVKFLSHPMVSGFTSAAALIIAFSQLRSLLGVHLPRSVNVIDTIKATIGGLSSVHGPTLLIGLLAIVALVLGRRYIPRFPMALIVVVVSTLAVALLNLDSHGVAIVGVVPAGLPMPGLPGFETNVLIQLIPSAIMISLIGFMESIAVARAMAKKYNVRLDANRELIGLGAANMAGGLFSGYPVTGGLSRTAVNAQAGAKTRLASIITASTILTTLLVFTFLFKYIPVTVLGAIIIVAVVGLIDGTTFVNLLKSNKFDAFVFGGTFLATLLLGVEKGLVVGVVLSLIVSGITYLRSRQWSETY